MNRLRNHLTAGSWLKYMVWRLASRGRPVTVRLQEGATIAVRPEPAKDLATAFEIFVRDVYARPSEVPDPTPRRIVDVGANVGFSILYWASRYPDARVLAFEPHPVHLAQARRNVELNRLSGRVELIPAAAAARSGAAVLSDRENESCLTPGTGRGIPVPVRDFFEAVGSGLIDLLKMDIEGGEYEILGDPRFATLPVRAVVLEWHDTVAVPDGKVWCHRRFGELGFRIEDGRYDNPGSGVLWAWRAGA